MSDDERFEDALDRLIEDKSPRAEAPRLSEEEQTMLRFAQLMRGSSAVGPDPEFVAELRDRTVGRPRVSRRSALLSAAGALAAGLLGGLGIERAVSGSGSSSTHHEALVGKHGTWMQVGTVADMPAGSVHPFTAGSVTGFVINHNGRYSAMSRICTHMGCMLKFQADEQNFACPCHGAEFTMDGNVRYGPHHYPVALPPLPKIAVRVRGQVVEVFGMEA